ncbi:hypothetical protein Hypma_004510 [Hypsizygus marmoreus]|uniref:Uncharacterized protein n=1 Tax=Hypsizygus marmoreus TaxID=39966 RepID=A0A369K3B6_HYPMA|nr:hypothetical protein Hypma_004510 [Hypsizygus marmoreus]
MAIRPGIAFLLAPDCSICLVPSPHVAFILSHTNTHCALKSQTSNPEALNLTFLRLSSGARLGRVHSAASFSPIRCLREVVACPFWLIFNVASICYFLAMGMLDVRTLHYVGAGSLYPWNGSAILPSFLHRNISEMMSSRNMRMRDVRLASPSPFTTCMRATSACIYPWTWYTPQHHLFVASKVSQAYLRYVSNAICPLPSQNSGKFNEGAGTMRDGDLPTIFSLPASCFLGFRNSQTDVRMVEMPTGGGIGTVQW